ncbi:hypothetical protein MW887_009585 [Aspergillus wentii]|nr:hypothetical protein MW887_009585 [Aspergillus wentii]
MAVSSSNPEPLTMGNSTKEFSTRSVIVLVGAFFANFCTLGFQDAFGVFQEYYSHVKLSSHPQSDIDGFHLCRFS